MNSLLDRLSDTRECVIDGIVHVDGEKVGVILPSLFEGRSESGQYYLCGRNGVETLCPDPSNENVFSSLIKSGSILFGRPDEIDHLAALLRSPSTSRTAAYYCCIANTCKDVVTAFRRIMEAKVLVVGCGGIGSLSAIQIAGAGVGDLTLVDPDVIEESNLNRQFFWSRDTIGKHKVDVLKDVILSRYNTTCNAVIRTVVDDELPELVKGFDAVILTADEPTGVGQVVLEKLARERGFILVCSGYSQQTALVRLIEGDHSSTHAHTADESGITWQRSNNFIGPSFGPTNVEIAGVVASMLLHRIGFPDTCHDSGSKDLNRAWQPALYARQTQI